MSQATASTRDERRRLDRDIVALALPALGALVAEPAFLLVDTALVGHLGAAQLAGVGIGGTVLQTAVGLLVFLAYGTTPAVARLLGAGDRPGAIRAGIDGIWLADTGNARSPREAVAAKSASTPKARKSRAASQERSRGLAR